ncbi:MAG: rhombosortase [Verrucomicrobia bacterium]|nr:rhombosortase [Verrucomicrobiota bacterium]
MKTRLPWLTLSVAAAAVAVHLLPAAADWLQFDRAALGRGELWRLVTAHLTHFGANHLRWDLGVLLAFGTACERQSRRRCAAALALAAVAITPALWAGQPQFALYRGLSGLDCALVGLFAASLLRHGRAAATLVGAGTLLVFAVKCILELVTAQTVFAAGTGYAPVPLAHLVGLAACLVAAVWRTDVVAHLSPDRRGIVAKAG